MKNKNFIKENRAVAGVIEAVLIVALIAIILSTVQLVYIPQVMKQREAEHMDEVSNQFSYLKSMIDIQTATRSEAPIFSIITLGCRELPYFVTARALGELAIIENENSKITCGGLFVAPLTSIEYNAHNSYYVDQTYIFEGGGVFLKQPNGKSVLRVDPPVYVKDRVSKIDISLNLTKVVCYKNKGYTGGYGKCFIRTNYSHTESASGNPYVIEGSISMKIYTEYPNAWYSSLNETMGKLVNLTVDSSESPSYVEIKEKDKAVDLYVTEAIVYAQIGPGWIN